MNSRLPFAVFLIAGSVVASDRWGDVYAAGLDLFNHGEYERARVVLIDAVAEARHRLPNGQELPTSLHTLGAAEQALHLYSDARRHLEAASILWSPARDGSRAAITSESLGRLLAETGEWEAADRQFEHAVALNERASGATSEETAAALSRVAEVYLSGGWLGKAKPLLIRALEIQKRSFPGGDSGLLTTELGLAHVLRGLGDFDAARRLAATMETAGRQSRIYPEILAILGDLYRIEGDLARAAPMLRRAIALAAARSSDRELPAAELSLGYIDFTEGRVRSARDRFEHALATMERLWGPATPELASARIGLASVMVEQGELDAAAALLDSARPLIERGFSEDHLFRAMEQVVRAAIVAARGNPGQTGEAARSVTAAIERQDLRNQAGLWATYARLIEPYRPDLAKAAGKRGRVLARGL